MILIDKLVLLFKETLINYYWNAGRYVEKVARYLRS